MTDISHIADRYIATWNETDPSERRALLAQIWAEDASYADPLMAGRGHEEIAALINGAQARFPGFRFALVGKADGFGDNLRFSWSLGPDGEEAAILGTDFAVLKDGRLKAVTGFLDKLPAAA